MYKYHLMSFAEKLICKSLGLYYKLVNCNQYISCNKISGWVNFQDESSLHMHTERLQHFSIMKNAVSFAEHHFKSFVVP